MIDKTYNLKLTEQELTALNIFLRLLIKDRRAAIKMLENNPKYQSGLGRSTTDILVSIQNKLRVIEDN